MDQKIAVPIDMYIEVDDLYISWKSPVLFFINNLSYLNPSFSASFFKNPSSSGIQSPIISMVLLDFASAHFAFALSLQLSPSTKLTSVFWGHYLTQTPVDKILKGVGLTFM